ncbi:Prostaglandin reductase 3 [Borealophlyctis nickersoniae]|nr:Prostaglandin reductase 3 [Borealophlyctis nickersoniae]
MAPSAVAPNLPQAFNKYVVHKLSNDFVEATRLETVQLSSLLDTLAPNSVVIQHHYVGINASDINYTAGRPFDCGFEAIGQIVAVGTAVKRVKMGQAVAVMQYGAFAEFQALDERVIIPIASLKPETLPLLVSGLTAALALKYQGGNPKGEVVLVTAAAGGAGQMAVQIAKMNGNTVIGTCSSDEKAATLKQLGCDRVINYKKENVREVLKKEYRKGVDVVFESVGGQMLQDCLDSLAVKGRLIIIGSITSYSNQAEGGPINAMASIWKDKVSTVGLLEKSASVSGFFMNHYSKELGATLNDLSYALANGSLKPLVEMRDFSGIESIPAAISYLHQGKNIGKVVVPLRKQAKL